MAANLLFPLEGAYLDHWSVAPPPHTHTHTVHSRLRIFSQRLLGFTQLQLVYKETYSSIILESEVLLLLPPHRQRHSHCHHRHQRIVTQFFSRVPLWDSPVVGNIFQILRTYILFKDKAHVYLHICSLCVVHFSEYYMQKGLGKTQSVLWLGQVFEESWFKYRNFQVIFFQKAPDRLWVPPTSLQWVSGSHLPG